MKSVALLLTHIILAAPLGAASVIDLAGDWRFALDPQDAGIHAKPDDWKFPDKIRLPGMLSAQGFGEVPSYQTQWTGDGWRYPQMFREWQAPDNFKFPFFLQPPRHYVGPAWYQRDLEIPGEWSGSSVVLHLERVHWQSTVWLDGKELGKADSLGTPHEFDLGPAAPGKHVLTIQIDNRLAPVNVGPLSHSVTDHTQGNWNGVVGAIELRQAPRLRIAGVRVFPSNSGKVKIEVGVVNRHFDPVGGTLAASIVDLRSGETLATAKTELSYPRGITENGGHIFVTGDQQTLECALTTKPESWNEFTPHLYQAKVEVRTEGGAVDARTTAFGFREVGTKDGRITLNGRSVFLRGTLECCIFPLTGHPPTDLDSWRRIIGICKAHGLNHMRFHSWCPPEAAFVVADEAGFYLAPEVSSWANGGAEIGSGRPLDAWLEAETGRMLAAYGNHPSFLMLAYGNEPAGRNHPKWLQEWVARRKKEDPRRLYTTGSGWPIMPGSDYHSTPAPRIQAWGGGMKSILNGQAPRTDFDWSDFVAKHADAPVISHEIGQWCVYPNFDEIGKYTGYFKARNFEIFRETAGRAGLLPQAKDFLMASGKWQAACYKHDIEAALRTPRFGGFQLLDLHDFPGQGTALVGVRDAFWDAKGYVSPAEFAAFCGPVVPLARLKKMVFTTAETLEAGVELAHFGPQDFKALGLTWKLVAADGTLVANGTLPERDLPAGDLDPVGQVRVPLDKVKAPAALTLTVGAPDGRFANSWSVFVYPADGSISGTGVPPVIPSPVPASGVSPSPRNGVAEPVLQHSLPEALRALAEGKSVLWLPPAAQVRNDPARPLVAGFSPIFWNTAWTNWQPPHTLGILCDPKHPAFASFPTDFHSNWQWWEIQQGAQPFILTGMREIKPLVQVIDDWFTNRKLGYVFEAKVGAGKLVACGIDLTNGLAQRPVARQLLASLLDYMGGGQFAPQVTLAPTEIENLLNPQ